ncbi:ankyrin repeat domain-containing protein [Virgibacillus sp. SK37]|uniref:ankyrin repeat domain-containing protein n=1 Tax=Virgibacillus sp. SK37 TaxID=403957 RepID=UPI0004D1AF6E|nr:ankyrin repeat domain-containing protein [Virgibacillus sp. SK37]AIF42144.1 ankyrin [Virgibacillus sp. SK37]
MVNEKKRDTKRIERIMYLLHSIWESNSDMRFFQLMDTLQHKYSFENNEFGKREGVEVDSKGCKMPISFIDLFYLEDDNLEEFLRDCVHSDKQRDSARTFMEILESNNTSKLAEYVKNHNVDHEINGNSLLYWAVYMNQIQIVKELLKLGADQNKKDLYGRSPLEIGSYYGFYEVCKVLLENGVMVDENSLNRARRGWGGNRQSEILKLLEEWQNR